MVSSTHLDNRVFNGEICTLLAILITFSTTYIMRGLFDIKVDMKLMTFVSMLSYLIVYFFCDYLPLMLLMTFHYRNFNSKATTNPH